MKKLLLLFSLFFFLISYSQETPYKEYSYSQLFDMIENEKDTIFKLSDAIIKYNAKTDSLFVKKLYDETDEAKDSIYKLIKKRPVNKHLSFNNVAFISKSLRKEKALGGILQNIEFKKSVALTNVREVEFLNCSFNKEFEISNLDIIPDKTFKKIGVLQFDFCDFYNKVKIRNFNREDTSNKTPCSLFNNTFHTSKIKHEKEFYEADVVLASENSLGMIFYKNTFLGNGSVDIFSSKDEQVGFGENNFLNVIVSFSFYNLDKTRFVRLSDNIFNSYTLLELDEVKPIYFIDWKQFNGKTISSDGYMEWAASYSSTIPRKDIYKTIHLDRYYKSERFKNKISFKYENTTKGQFYNHFKSKMDNEYANMVYVENKDLETQHSKYLYSENPSFETFFKWRINQFLKVFSAYGTKPERAVVFSMWVILFFAFIYLLFPNSWDKHGKNRIINRYKFFTKYMKKDAGIHEVYLDDQKEELLEYEEFKNYMTTSGKSIPKFFLATSLPLYKWAISGTKFSSGILRRVDIMKGTWDEVPKKKRIWKSILLIGAFLIAICYDIFIKMLNALMLSINTFTTLGFGEIPIKGLPRYLAIIQGFIGWFMLTIFSVSLISQLLN